MGGVIKICKLRFASAWFAMAQGLFTGGARTCRGWGNRGAGTGVPAPAGRKLFSRALRPHGRKEKTQGTYFEICALCFKICQTCFSPPGNRPANRPRRGGQKRRGAPAAAGCVLCVPLVSLRRCVVRRVFFKCRICVCSCSLRISASVPVAGGVCCRVSATCGLLFLPCGLVRSVGFRAP